MTYEACLSKWLVMDITGAGGDSFGQSEGLRDDRSGARAVGGRAGQGEEVQEPLPRDRVGARQGRR